MTEIAKHARSVRLAGPVHERLLAVCEHLGVSPNAYIVAEVGRAVSRDEVALVAKGERTNLFGQLENLINSEMAE
jgi:hypothetical protein